MRVPRLLTPTLPHAVRVSRFVAFWLDAGLIYRTQTARAKVKSLKSNEFTA